MAVPLLSWKMAAVKCSALAKKAADPLVIADETDDSFCARNYSQIIPSAEKGFECFMNADKLPTQSDVSQTFSADKSAPTLSRKTQRRRQRKTIFLTWTGRMDLRSYSWRPSQNCLQLGSSFKFDHWKVNIRVWRSFFVHVDESAFNSVTKRSFRSYQQSTFSIRFYFQLCFW